MGWKSNMAAIAFVALSLLTPERGFRALAQELSSNEPAIEWTKPPRCAAPRTHSEADLCEQRRMAKAAERTLWLGYLQAFIGFFGLIALLSTVHFSRKATLAAVAASDAAQAAVHTERAWITLEEFDVDYVDGGLIVSVELKNAGRSPAIAVRDHIQIQVLSVDAPMADFTPPPVDHAAHLCTIGPGETLWTDDALVGSDDLDAILDKKRRLYLYCRIDYRDVFSTVARTTAFQVYFTLDLDFDGKNARVSYDAHAYGTDVIN